MNSIGIIIGIIREGLIYSIVSFGVYITYKILDFPDMTVDGSFPLGMSVTAVLILHNVNPILALLISFFVGVICGIATGLINVKLGVKDLLSGIIVMTALYSIEIKVAGRANLPFFHKETFFDNGFVRGFFPNFIHNNYYYKPIFTLVQLICIVAVCKILLDKYLKTKSGYLLRAVGDNDTLVTSLAVDKGNIKILGLAIANGLAALAGSVYAQDRAAFEISAGTGTLVISVANVIIGMQILKNFSIIKATTAIIIGSILYRACISLALSCGMSPMDLKLITALILLIILALNNVGKKVKND